MPRAHVALLEFVAPVGPFLLGGKIVIVQRRRVGERVDHRLDLELGFLRGHEVHARVTGVLQQLERGEDFAGVDLVRGRRPRGAAWSPESTLNLAKQIAAARFRSASARRICTASRLTTPGCFHLREQRAEVWSVSGQRL